MYSHRRMTVPPPPPKKKKKKKRENCQYVYIRGILFFCFFVFYLTKYFVLCKLQELMYPYPNTGLPPPPYPPPPNPSEIFRVGGDYFHHEQNPGSKKPIETSIHLLMGLPGKEKMGGGVSSVQAQYPNALTTLTNTHTHTHTHKRELEF